MDYLEVVHVFIRGPASSRAAVNRAGQAHRLDHQAAGYPTKNALKARYREYKSSQELRTGYKRPAKFSQAQREQAVEHYHLGSTIGIVDEGGQLLQHMSYDAWGRRRNIDGSDDSWGSLGTIKNG